MSFSTRTFGVEIEFTGGSVQKATTTLINAGIVAVTEGYNHQTRNHWKVTTDASVDRSGVTGGEVVSPVLKGERGLSELRLVLEALSAGGFKVNKSCGIHVHVGVSDLSVAALKTVFLRYAKHEDKIDAIMPRSRRGNANTYCQGFVHYNGSGINLDNATTVNDIMRSGQRNGRFCKLNLGAYVRQATIEFRQHSGSLNSAKVANWVLFCLNFVDASVKFARPFVAGNRRCSARLTKKDKLIELLKQNYLSVFYLAREIDSTPNSVQAMLTSIRKTHDVCRVGGRGYYEYIIRGERAAVVASSPPEDSSPFAGLSLEVTNWFEERALDLCTS